jgi:uncharacterized protein YbbC (DUF1343 family)
MLHVLNGVDRLESIAPQLKGKRVGLVTAASGVDREGIQTYTRLADISRLEILFAPEHGIRSNLQDGQWAEDARDEETGARLFTMNRRLYDRLPEVLGEVDVVAYDIQDVGARFYTYLYNLTHMMQACASAGVPIMVLDRVNPINGVQIEGEILDESKHRSGIGEYAIPTRYGLTIGEFAQWVNAERGIGCDLRVVPCEGWRREAYADETDLLFVNPSPNIPSVNAAINYIGTCIFEATNISEGRGTTRPFDMVGAPFVNSARLCEEMKGYHLPGVIFRRVWFTPMFNKHAGTVCEGVELHITDRRTYRPIETMLYLYRHMKSYPQFEAKADGLALRFGSGLLSQDYDIPSFLSRNARDLSAFEATCRPYLIYQD